MTIRKLRSGERVSYFLREKGWSQSELAARIGMTRATISNIVTGANPPSQGTMEKILGAFDVGPGYFWGVVIDDPLPKKGVDTADKAEG